MSFTSPAQQQNEGVNTVFYDPERVAILITDEAEIAHVEDLAARSAIHNGEQPAITPVRILQQEKDATVNGPLCLEVEDEAHGLFELLQGDIAGTLSDSASTEKQRSAYASRLLLGKLCKAVTDPEVDAFNGSKGFLPAFQNMARSVLAALTE